MGFSAILIGSGPTGAACAAALLDAGHRVQMLDGGFRLEPHYAAQLDRLRRANSSGWSTSAESAFLREQIAADVDGIPLKRAYGSDFPYRSVAGATSVECSGAHTHPSLAAGGLSNVWGAAMLPYRQADMTGWPISEGDLGPHYEAVLRHVPLAGRDDALASILPLWAQPRRLWVSSQAATLLARFDRNRQALAAENLIAGASRLAVSNEPDLPCVACSLCMYGCPRGLIYCSATEIDRLKNYPGFSYRPGVYIQRIAESNGRASVTGFEMDSDAPFAADADRIFVACGTVATTALLLRSLDAYDKPVTMADSQYFLQPCATLRGASRVTREKLHTLSQAFVEIVDEAISRYTIHLQLYTYNELFAQALLRTAGPLRPFVPKDMLLGRLILLQGYLHSAESAAMTCTLEKTESGDTLRIEATGKASTDEIIRKVQRKLMKAARLTGLIPIPPLLRPGDPGRGYHSGGTFPMSHSPAGFQTDCAGTPPDFSRIHVVDSTVFPSIAATTITLTAMANAHRIGTMVGQA